MPFEDRQQIDTVQAGLRNGDGSGTGGVMSFAIDPGGGSDIRVHPNGRFVYTCTRANSSIAVFSIEETSGRLTQVDIAPTLGRGPRNINFSPSGRFLFACNFGSNEVHTFEIDPDSGRLTPTGAVASTLKPACIKLLAL